MLTVLNECLIEGLTICNFFAIQFTFEGFVAL